MERLNRLCLTGAALALGIASLPAGAQNNQTTTQTTTTQTTTRVTQDRITSMQNDMAWDRSLPASPSQNKMVLLQMMTDKSFSKSDIMKVLPLLQDLRDAQNLYMFGMEDAASYWVTLPDQSKMNGMDTARTAATNFRNRRDSIWNAINTAIGADKASVLRGMIEPSRMDLSTYAYTDTHLQRIDELIRQWDQQAAARVAANGGTPNNTASTVSVETTTTTTTTSTIPGLDVWTYPALTAQDLVDVMQTRLLALEAEGDPVAILAIRNEPEITSNDLRFLREHRLKYWY